MVCEWAIFDTVRSRAIFFQITIFSLNSDIAIFSRIAIFFRASESFRRYKYYDGNWFQFPTSETGFGFRHEFIDVNLYVCIHTCEFIHVSSYLPTLPTLMLESRRCLSSSSIFGVERTSVWVRAHHIVSKILTDIIFYVSDIPHSTCTISET